MENPIRSSIIKTYEDNYSSLSTSSKFHWDLRMWRISGKEMYKERVFNGYTSGAFKEKSYSGKKMGPKRKLRNEYYKKHPLLLSTMREIHQQFYKMSFGVAGVISKSSITTPKLEEMLMDERLIIVDPSQVANYTYYLKALDLCDLEDKMITKMKTVWLDKNPGSKIEWQNKIYGFTHIIIASTYFYQRSINSSVFRKKFRWITNYFESNIDHLLTVATTDIITEIALCFRFLGLENKTAYKKARNFVAGKFDYSVGYIPGKSKDLSKGEHRNILAVMLFTEDLKFKKGPNLLDKMVHMN